MTTIKDQDKLRMVRSDSAPLEYLTMHVKPWPRENVGFMCELSDPGRGRGVATVTLPRLLHAVDCARQCEASSSLEPLLHSLDGKDCQ